LTIADSRFDFYYKGVLIDTLEKCKNMERADVSKSVLKANLKLENNDYRGFICPFLFSIGETLLVKNITTKNSPRFMNVIPKTPIDINPNLNAFDIYFSEVSLDRTLLNDLVFGNMKLFGIFDGKIASIQSSIFRRFKKLLLINFELQDVSSFVRETNNEWLSSVNSDVRIDFNDQSSIDAYRSREMYIDFGTYDYPEEDFCYFRRFPAQRLVFASMARTTAKECSCTVIWLLQFYSLSSNKQILLNDFTIRCSANLPQSIQSCKFNEKIKACNNA
jgi:hypothetical protein